LQKKIAGETKAGLEGTVIASIGPTTSATLSEYGLHRDVEPSHPKMGNLILETAQQAATILATKRHG
jgi:uroporphyrinogen decarboxylase